MTKEELEKEAEKYADTVKCEWENDTYWVDCRDKVTDAYLASAEPREKQIAELEESNKEWQRTCEAKSDTNSQLTEQLANKAERIAELEAQIDKTKNAFKKIIKTVHNDNISSYGDRLVIIYDISCEVLQELEK